MLTGNHGRIGQLEPGPGDGALLEKSCLGKREFFTSSVSPLKLLLLSDAYFFTFFFRSGHKYRSVL